MKTNVIVCLPTYNELENINHMVAAVNRHLPEAFILIIDDHSPDDTGKLADSLAQNNSRVSVLHRLEKKGLGKAYLHGFRIAIDKMGAQYIIQMDADFSHPPESLPSMMSAVQRADLVIGSRYIPEGKTLNWNAIRRMISRFGALYVRFWLNLPVFDPTGGFKVWRRELLQNVLDYPIGAGGYVFQVETTCIAFNLGARIVEVPICFTERRVGLSKMTPLIAFEAFWRIPVMRFLNRRWAYKFKR